MCFEDTDPYLLDFTNIVTLRFINKVIVKKRNIYGDSAYYYVYLLLKDGREFAYYERTADGSLIPGAMELRKDPGGKWRVVPHEFWETYHWKEVTRKVRLNIIALTEGVIHYRDEKSTLPESLKPVMSPELDTISNPVTGGKEAFVSPAEIGPGAVSFYFDRENNEVDIKGYDVLGKEIDFFIVSASKNIKEAGLLEFYDVPPRTITTVTPSYPESEREKGVEGIVSLRLLIGRDGMVEDVKVVKHLSVVFDSLAVQTVKQSVFSPAKRNGRPIAVWYYLPVRFVLKE